MYKIKTSILAYIFTAWFFPTKAEHPLRWACVPTASPHVRVKCLFTPSWRQPLTPPPARQRQETFRPWTVTAGFDERLFTSGNVLGVGARRPYGRAHEGVTQITANTRNAFPPGGFWRLDENERKRRVSEVEAEGRRWHGRALWCTLGFWRRRHRWQTGNKQIWLGKQMPLNTICIHISKSPIPT